jgi:hypothetical protein
VPTIRPQDVVATTSETAAAAGATSTIMVG